MQVQDGPHLLPCLHQVHPALGNPRKALGRLHHHLRKRAVGVKRLASPLQECCIAGLKAQRRDLHQGVRARLEDHADHADRYRDPVELEPIIQFGGRLCLPDGIGLARHAAHAHHDLADQLGLVHLQTLHQRVRQLAFLQQLRRRLQILTVRLEDPRRVPLQCLRDGLQRRVPLGLGSLRQPQRRFARRLCHVYAIRHFALQNSHLPYGSSGIATGWCVLPDR